MDDLDKLMKKLNKKEKAVVVALFDELWHLKEENDELIHMFLTERFPQAKEKVCRKYKNKNTLLDKENATDPGLPVEQAPSTM